VGFINCTICVSSIVKAIFKAFSNTALEGYTKVTQTITQNCIDQWCTKGNVLGYQEFKSLTFEISCRVLLGIKMTPEEKKELMDHFDIFERKISLKNVMQARCKKITRACIRQTKSSTP
jgi:cytochrome P450